ncbi:MAG TPA: ATP-binding protein [Thiobacillus sp.]
MSWNQTVRIGNNRFQWFVFSQTFARPLLLCPADRISGRKVVVRNSCQIILSGVSSDISGAAPPRSHGGIEPVGWNRNIMNALAAQVALLDEHGTILAVNQAWSEFANHMYSDEPVACIGSNYLDALRVLVALGNHSASDALHGMGSVLSREIARFDLDFHCHSTLQSRWLLMQVTALPETTGCLISFLDITERKQSEDTRAQLAAILEATPDFVGMADEQGTMLYANQALRQLRGVGLQSEAPLGQWKDVYPDWAAHIIQEEALPTAVRAGDWSGEVAVLDASGHEVRVHQVILAHRNTDGEIDFFSTSMRNLTESQQQAAALRQAFDELKQTQDQLVNSEKMASIGQLTAGVAHEINNPVGYLNSNLSTLSQYVGDLIRMVESYEAAMFTVPDSSVRADVDRVKRETDLAFLLEDLPKLVAESREGTQRVRKIVQDLKDFAHAGHNEEWQWVDLRNSLERTLNIVHNELKYKADILQDYGTLPEIRCLPGQLNQVFMNLLINAGQAIQENGQVRVTAGQVEDQVWIEISDNGCGMPADVIGHIFDPFFTTKPVGKGTGLGLSISYGIVQKHGGTITVSSEIGQGTTFRMMLPIAGPQAALA